MYKIKKRLPIFIILQKKTKINVNWCMVLNSDEKIYVYICLMSNLKQSYPLQYIQIN